MSEPEWEEVVSESQWKLLGLGRGWAAVVTFAATPQQYIGEIETPELWLPNHWARGTQKIYLPGRDAPEEARTITEKAYEYFKEIWEL